MNKNTNTKKIAVSVFVLSIVGSALFVGGCADNLSPSNYDAQDVGKLNKVVKATIVSMRPISIQSSNTGTGTLAGGAIGAIAGSSIGGSSRGNLLGAVGGAVVGGIAGNAIEKGIGKQQGMEYVMKSKEDGSLFTVTQTKDLQLHIGQKVLVMYGRQVRVIPDDIN